MTTTTTIIKIKEIHCVSCENTIRTILLRLPGVVHVAPSAEFNEVKVSHDDAKIGEPELRQRLLEVGYEPIS